MPWNKTSLTEKLGIEVPIVLGPMGGFPTEQLAAIVSNFGGLGSFGGLNLNPRALQDAIDEIRSLTPNPFSVNLWLSTEDQEAFTVDKGAFERSLAPLIPLIREAGGSTPSFTPYQPQVRFEEQVRVLLDANIPAFSFIFGLPPEEVMEECRRRKIVTIGSATTPDEARFLCDGGVDVIVASGFEGGGHRTSFLRPAEESLMGTFSLVPQISDLVDVPVVAAGGIADGRGIAAALTLGADGVQMGTAFLACKESGASQEHRDALLGGQAGVTRLTRAFSGRLGRAIENRLMRELRGADIEILPYTVQRALVRSISVPADAAGRADLVPFWAGQSANLAHCPDAEALLESLVIEVDSILGAREEIPFCPSFGGL